MIPRGIRVQDVFSGTPRTRRQGELYQMILELIEEQHYTFISYNENPAPYIPSVIQNNPDSILVFRSLVIPVVIAASRGFSLSALASPVAGSLATIGEAPSNRILGD